jgi:RNA polymerase sigma-70 factor (ECF subfamily)
MLVDPDRTLIEACQDPNGDGFESAFEALYTRYKDRVFNVAYRITGNVADAMDVAQEAFGLVFRKISGFRFESKFSSWLYRLVVNISIDQKRRNGQTVARFQTAPKGHDLSADAEDIEDGRMAPPEEALAAMELGAAVQAAIGCLSPKLRAIVVLRYLQDLSYEELAETLEISMGTVKSRLARAHLALETIFGDSLRRFGFTPERADPPARDGAAGSGSAGAEVVA